MPSSIETGIVFVCYFVVLILIGFFFFKRTDTLPDFFIGGRRLNPWLSALSVYAGDMSGWLMLGLIGTVYSFGIGQMWIALGLVLGTLLNWLLVARRLRRYTLTTQYSITIPEYFENRFKDTSHILRFISALIIAVFFVVYTSAGFVACGLLFEYVFGIDYQIALLAGALVIFTYTFMGGFRAICWTDLVQALLILAVVVSVPLTALYRMEGADIFTAHTPEFFDIFTGEKGRPLTTVSILSKLAWGLGYFGMPHILVRFMALRREREIPWAAGIGGLAAALSLGCAVLMGMTGLFFVQESSSADTVFILIIQRLFMGPGSIPFLGNLFLCGILAAIMSTTDSQLLAAASAITSDLYQGMAHRNMQSKQLLWLSRFTVALICIIAYIIAVGRSSTIMGLVSNAWSGFGSAFGALILLSLYWRRLNRSGAIAGILAGGLTVILWDYIPCVPAGGAWNTINEATGLYSLAPGFCASMVFIVAVSLLTKPPVPAVYEEFERASIKPIFEE